MWQQRERLAQLNIKVIVITFESATLFYSKEDRTLPGFPYLVDEKRELYQHYGIMQAGFWDLWGPRTWLIYLRLLLKGRKMISSQSDIHQRGGDVLIDPHGLVRFHHIGTGPADRPDIDSLWGLVEQYR